MREFKKEIEVLVATIAKNKLALGQVLIDAKEELPHGEFLPMLKEVGLAKRTAQDYMKLAGLDIVEEVSKSANIRAFDKFNNKQIKQLDTIHKEDPEKALEIAESGDAKLIALAYPVSSLTGKPETTMKPYKELYEQNKEKLGDCAQRSGKKDEEISKLKDELYYAKRKMAKLEDENKALKDELMRLKLSCSK